MEVPTDKITINESNRNRANPLASIGVLIALIAGLLGGFIGAGVFGLLENSFGDESSATQFVSGESELISKVAENVGESVVSITSRSVSDGFFSFSSDGAGTGIILTNDGIVVTNKHVVPEDTDRISVVFSDGSQSDSVDVLGRDPFNDVAFLRINGRSDLKPAKLADSADVRVGEKVIAIGNALGQYENTVTSGIISGLSRPIVTSDSFGSNPESLTGLFQTDTSINPGNSGGPLVNINGEVIGINTAIAGDAENIGFAIPINDIKGGFESVINNGRLVKPYVGVRYISVDPAVAQELNLSLDEGAYIPDEPGAIVNDGPAEKAGLARKDHIVSVNGQVIDQNNTLVQAINQHQVGDEVTLQVKRGSDNIELSLTLEEVPSDLR